MLRHQTPRMVVVVGYVFVALAFSWPLPLHLGTALTGDTRGDTGVYVWNQWVFHHRALVERRNPLTTEHVLSLTSTVDLSQHNYTVFSNLLALPLISWLGVVRTFNIVFLAITVLTALATYALARGVTKATRLEAWIAGLAFAWTPALVARSTGHFSLVAAAPLAAFLLCLIRADRSRRAFDAALAGASMAWAAFCDPYYAVYCLLIAAGYLIPRLMRVTWSRERGRVRWRWALNLMIVLLAGLIVGVSAGGGGRITVAGIPISVRGLYTPMLVMTGLVVARLLVELRPHLHAAGWLWSMRATRVVVIGGIACATLLSPVLYGLGTSIVEGRFASPPTLWRSSPRGVDLLSFIAVNPHHPLVRAVHDQQTADPAALAEFTAAVSLIALGVIGFAIWRGGYRPHRGWIWLTAGFASLALGPFIYVAGVNTYVPGPWALLRYIPVIDAVRAPTRFAIVAALGVAVLFAAALAAIGARYPRRRNLIATAIGAALVFELSPVPRTLFSAEIPALYQIVAADPRPVRFIELPFGVRDGTFTVGNFSARYLYYQTVHEKRVMGGYLSRISKKRVDEIRAQPTLDALIRLSEGDVFTPEEYQRLRARGPRFIERSDLAWVVINHDTSPQPLVDFVIDAWQLQEVAREGPKVLYRPTL